MPGAASEVVEADEIEVEVVEAISDGVDEVVGLGKMVTGGGTTTLVVKLEATGGAGLLDGVYTEDIAEAAILVALLTIE